MIFSCEYVAWEYFYSVMFVYIFLSAAAAIFVVILQFYGEFQRKVDKNDTYNFPLWKFVSISTKE